MNENFSLGITNIGSGDLLTFLINDESTPHRPQQVSIIALADIDVSKEMADYYDQLDRTRKNVMTDNALIGFVDYLAQRNLVRVPKEVRVPFGTLRRPASRLANEYKYSMNPEQFWEEKLLHRYGTACFTVFNHQGHTLTAMANVDAQFCITATIIDISGGTLGMLRLDLLSSEKYTLIDDDDLERLRLGLQADLTMHVPDLLIMVERVTVTHNPTFDTNRFKRHCFPAATAVQETVLSL